MRKINSAICSAVIIIFASYISASDAAVVSYAKSLKGHRFALKAHEQLFGFPNISQWDDRLLYKAHVSVENGETVVNDHVGWPGSYFVSGSIFDVRDVKTQNGAIELKLWKSSGLRIEPEIKLSFNVAISPEDFKKAISTLFFEPYENRDNYVEENNQKLIAKFLDPEPELFLLSVPQRLKLLLLIRSISLSGQPAMERVGQSLYIPATVMGNASVYNDAQINKNVRIASSVEGLLDDLRRISGAASDFPDAIAGVKFQWIVYHRNFLKDSKYAEGANTLESMEMLVSRQSLKEFTEGNLSPYELVQKSILRENGIKVTLTSYEPIGSR